MNERALVFADEMTVRRDLRGLATSEGVRSVEQPLDPPEPEARHTIEMPMAFDPLEAPPVDEESTPATPMSIAVSAPSAPTEGSTASVVAVRPIIGIG